MPCQCLPSQFLDFYPFCVNGRSLGLVYYFSSSHYHLDNWRFLIDMFLFGRERGGWKLQWLDCYQTLLVVRSPWVTTCWFCPEGRDQQCWAVLRARNRYSQVLKIFKQLVWYRAMVIKTNGKVKKVVRELSIFAGSFMKTTGSLKFWDNKDIRKVSD
jgi:hypothetical protein